VALVEVAFIGTKQFEINNIKDPGSKFIENIEMIFLDKNIKFNVFFYAAAR